MSRRQESGVLRKNRPIKRAKAPEYKTIYANNAEIQLTPWDFRIRLGQIEQATENLLEIEDVAVIYMSPAHMKAFVDAATQNVAKYEALFGPILDPTEIGKKGEEAKATPSQ
jgi:hypothetical protein